MQKKSRPLPCLFLSFTQEHGGYGSVTLDRPPSLSPSALPPTKLGPGPPTSLTTTCARSSLCLDKTNTQERNNRPSVASMHAKTLQTWIHKSRPHRFFASKRSRASYKLFLFPSHRSTVATNVCLTIHHMPSLLHLPLQRDSDTVAYETSPALSPSARPPTGLGPAHPLSLASTCARSTLCFHKKQKKTLQ